MSIIFLLALALAPGAAIALFIFLRDIHEPEPLKPLLLGVFCGAISFFVALGISYVIDQKVSFARYDIIEQGFKAFLLVGLVEEASKFAFIRGILFPHKEFNEPFDGIVYSVMVAMGFATVENVLYVVQGGGGVAILRMFSAVPAHAIFAVIMGFFLGEAKMNPERNLLFSSLALISAVIIHGLYDYFLFISFIPGIWLGAALSFGFALVLAQKAIKIHQDRSPFKTPDNQE